MFSSNTSSAAGGYQISRSLRFNAPDNANLDRGFTSSPTNSKIMTFSAWIKRCRPGDYDGVFSANNGVDQIRFQNSDGLHIELNNAAATVTTTQVFRDPSSWYHIVVAFDTTQATASNRVKVYVNGTQVTSFATANYPAQNYDLQLNGSTNQRIGIANNTVLPMAGYMTEIYRIDGQALTPSSFGETNAQTGVWQPKAYTGSYGTNGFYLNFSDNSNTTAATLGKDYSGNGNNWTPNNFSVAAGAGNDSLVDTPTPYGSDSGAGGEVRGNYCTWNPLAADSSATITNGNLDVATAAAGVGQARGTIGVSSGKWYWEVTRTTSGANLIVGIVDSATGADKYPGQTSGSYGYYGLDGTKINNGSFSAYGASFGIGDVIGVALDLDAGTLVFYKNGTSQGTAFTGLSGTFFPAASDDTGGGGMNYWGNFGQRPFAYTAPSGFRALCTQNLPTPTIGATTATQAGKYFNTALYAGNNGTQAITGLGFQPDLVWTKDRTNPFTHIATDVIRGVGKSVYPSANDAEVTNDSNGYLSAFGSDGFTVTAGSSSALRINATGSNYVGWAWRANGSGVTNTAGSVTSTVSANTASGFSIVTCSPSGSAFTVGHGLGVAPRFIISKLYQTANGWNCYHASLGADKYLVLNSTSTALTSTTLWQNTAPTSTVLSFAAVSSPMLFYCFAEVPGFSRISSYTGNGSTDGPFVFTGFRPKFVLIKSSTVTASWTIQDGTRSPSNAVSNILYPDLNNAEDVGVVVDFLSNGFKVRTLSDTYNNNGNTYVFAAFAESPFKFALAR